MSFDHLYAFFKEAFCLSRSPCFDGTDPYFLVKLYLCFISCMLTLYKLNVKQIPSSRLWRCLFTLISFFFRAEPTKFDVVPFVCLISYYFKFTSVKKATQTFKVVRNIYIPFSIIQYAITHTKLAKTLPRQSWEGSSQFLT